MNINSEPILAILASLTFLSTFMIATIPVGRKLLKSFRSAKSSSSIGIQHRRYSIHIYNALDFVMAVSCIITMIPIYLFLFIGLSYETRGKAIRKSVYIGKGSKLITLYSFNVDRNRIQMLSISRFAHLLYLDQIPRLLNIAKGDISSIGVKLIGKDLFETASVTLRKDYSNLLAVYKPGLVNIGALVGQHDLDNSLEYDKYFVANDSIKLRLKVLIGILAKTINRKGI